MITSLQNPRVKEVVHLRDARQRAKRVRLVIDGRREIEAALAGRIEIVEAFICRELECDASARLRSQLEAQGVPVFEVTTQVMQRMAFGSRVEGVLAVARPPLRTIGELALGAAPLVAVLEGLEKPGNVGAVIRTADAAGLTALVVAEPRTDLFNPNTIRASLGTVFTLPTAIADSAAALDWLRHAELQIVAARPAAERRYYEVDFRRPTAIVLGSEARGLEPHWGANDVLPVSLPMLGRADSLNVSAAAAALFYEALRQRISARHPG